MSNSNASAMAPTRKRSSRRARLFTRQQIQEQAAASLEITRRHLVKSENVLDFIPRMTPLYSKPHHLAGYVDLLEACVGTGNQRIVGNLPPRHGKTETLINFIAWTLRKRPELTIGFATYGAALARSVSNKIRTLVKRCGVALSETDNRVDEWRTLKGGGLLAAGLSGSWTGHGIDIFVIDDPIKNRIEAESPLFREKVWDWYTDVAYTRLEKGASVIVNQTRWHKDDLSGRLIGADEPFEVVRHAAIDDKGRPLWPEVKSLEDLERIRRTVGPYTWASLFQQRPIARGGSVFSGTFYYDRLPPGAFRACIGLDLAYTESKRADFSALVVLAEFEREPGVYYVIDAVRGQVKAPAFVREIKDVIECFPGAPIVWIHGGGGESGIISFLENEDIRIDGRSASALGDKFTRSQSCAADWNVDADDPGDKPCILVPRSTCGDDCEPLCGDHPPPEWCEPFVTEVLDFTGRDGDTDDQVDALVASHLGLAESRIGLF